MRETDPYIALLSKERSGLLRSAIGKLKPRYRDVLSRRSGLDGTAETLKAIGVDIGISASRVSEIEKRALRDLKHPRYGLSYHAGDPVPRWMRSQRKVEKLVQALAHVGGRDLQRFRLAELILRNEGESDNDLIDRACMRWKVPGLAAGAKRRLRIGLP